MILKPSIFTKIYMFSLLIILGTALFIGFKADFHINDSFLTQLKGEIETKLVRAESALRHGLLREDIIEISEAAKAFSINENVGVSVFDWKGDILADSRDQLDNFDNQPLRKEVHQVIKEGASFLIRFSPPMDSQAMFLARKQEEVNETIGSIRISSSLAALSQKRFSLAADIAATSFILALFAILPSALLAWFLAKPINFLRKRAEHFNLQKIRSDSSIHRQDEIGKLARAQDKMAEKFQHALDETCSESRLSFSILSAMLEGVIALDTNEKVVFMNLKAAELLETDPADSMKRPLWEITRKLEISNEIVRALKEGITQPVDVKLVRQGADIYLKLYTSHFLDENNDVSGIIVVLRDVTKLQNLADHRAELVTNVAHEFKTPLTVISGISETLIDDPDMPAAPRDAFIRKISRQAKRLTDLASDMLELSRIELRKNGLKKATHDLRSILKDCYESFQASCKNPDISFSYSEPEKKLLIVCDRQALQKIADNLMDNAVKYSPMGGKITVSLSSTGRQHIIEIADTGIGIDPSDQSKIFQRFYRTDRARSPQIKGSGLGLAIVKKIVEVHDGSIEVTSFPGKGSTFRITLPSVDD